MIEFLTDLLKIDNFQNKIVAAPTAPQKNRKLSVKNTPLIQIIENFCLRRDAFKQLSYENARNFQILVFLRHRRRRDFFWVMH